MMMIDFIFHGSNPFSYMRYYIIEYICHFVKHEMICMFEQRATKVQNEGTFFFEMSRCNWFVRSLHIHVSYVRYEIKILVPTYYVGPYIPTYRFCF